MALASEDVIDVDHLVRQMVWSMEAFGPGPRTQGVLDHIRKELVEIEEAPDDLAEWVDVIILAFDGAWRAGHLPKEIIAAVKVKQGINERRNWPDWRTMSEDVAIEHDRTGDCNTCGGTGRWESTTEDSPTVPVDLGPCPDCLCERCQVPIGDPNHGDMHRHYEEN